MTWCFPLLKKDFKTLVLAALRTYEPPVSKELCCIEGSRHRVCSGIKVGDVGYNFCSEVLMAAGVPGLGSEPSQKCCFPYAFLL